MTRKRIFFLHGEPYAAGLIAALRRRGIDVPVCTSRGAGSYAAYARELDADAVHFFSTQARFGVLPENFSIPLSPAPLRDIEALAPSAAWSLQMLDRMNLHGWAVSELNRLYLNLIGIWRTLLDRYRPDAVVMSSGVPMFGFDHVLYELCRLDRRPFLMFMHTHLEGHLLPTRNLHEVPGPGDAEIDAAPAVGEHEVSFVSPTNEKLHAEAMNLKTLRRKLSPLGVARALVGRRMMGRHRPEPWFLYEPQPHEMEVHWQLFKGRLLSRQCLRRYDEMVQKPDLGADYVYFPLPTEPEEGTMPLGGHFDDILHVLRTVAAALPAGWRLYVKEHPNQFNRRFLMCKGRNLHFYDRLAEIPHVTAVPLEVPGRELIDHARAVVVVAGSSGWESLQMRKPPIVFGFPWYLRAPGVVRADGVESCKLAIERIARGDASVSLERLRRYTKLMRDRYTAPLIYAQGFLPYAQISVEQHLENYVALVEDAVNEHASSARSVHLA